MGRKRVTKIKKICKFCNKYFYIYKCKLKEVGVGSYCSKRCRGRHKTGNTSPVYKGGRTKHSRGYVLILTPKHPYKNIYNDYIFEHRLVMEKYLGRYLMPEERVHHINGKKDDNRIKNLKLFANIGEHMRFHCLLTKRSR